MAESNCDCDICKGACAHKPGWFLPGEAEKAAELLGLSLDVFFKNHLLVDYLTGDPDIFLLSPAVIGADPGEEFPADPKGRCVFYKDSKCSIYAARPHECREYFHTQSHEEAKKRHIEIAEAWKGDGHQEQIVALLGREPVSSSWSIFDEMGFGGLFSSDW